MSTPDLDSAFQLIVERLAPGAKFVGHRPLTGGVSAQIEALEFTWPEGQDQQVVVRREASTEWKPGAVEGGIATEFAL